MAQNLQLLKRRIKTAKNISQIAKAMEMISASKIKRAQTAVENNKPYAERITDLTTRLINAIRNKTDEGKFTHPYIDNQSESTNKLVIILSPDKGLCGSLNTNLAKKIATLPSANIQLVTVGTKIGRFAARLDLELLASFTMGNSLPSYAKVFDLVRFIEETYNTGNVAEVELIYTKFHSFFAQTPVIEKLLPLGRISQENAEEGLSYIFEPNLEEILKLLLPHYIETKLYNALIEAYTSEQAARMLAMQNAKNNASDIADYLTLAYNKSRQERITNDILDITNAAQL